MSASPLAPIDERAIAIARESLPENETLVDGIMVMFINDVGFEQVRLMVLTNAHLYRVKFDWTKWRVVHSRALPLSAIVDVALGHVAKQTGGQTKGFAVKFRIADARAKSSPDFNSAPPLPTTSPTSPRRVASTTFMGIDAALPPLASTAAPSAATAAVSSQSLFAARSRSVAVSDMSVAYTAASRPRTTSTATTFKSTNLLPQRDMEYVYFISDDSENEERKLERFLKALVTLAPNVNGISEKITIAGKSKYFIWSIRVVVRRSVCCCIFLPVTVNRKSPMIASVYNRFKIGKSAALRERSLSASAPILHNAASATTPSGFPSSSSFALPPSTPPSTSSSGDSAVVSPVHGLVVPMSPSALYDDDIGTTSASKDVGCDSSSKRFVKSFDYYVTTLTTRTGTTTTTTTSADDNLHIVNGRKRENEDNHNDSKQQQPPPPPSMFRFRENVQLFCRDGKKDTGRFVDVISTIGNMN
jgi:hypothetical protein